MKSFDQIAKITIELESAGEGRLQHEEDYLQLFRGYTIRALEEALEELQLSHTLLKLHKIEIDLGEIPASLMGSEYQYRLVQAFKEKIKDLLMEVKAFPTPGNELLETSALSYEEQMMHFLKTGQLSWEIQKQKQTTAKILLEILSKNIDNKRDYFVLLAKDEKMLTRLFNLLSEKEQMEILEQVPFLKGRTKRIENVFQELKHTFEKGGWQGMSSWKGVVDFLLKELVVYVYNRQVFPDTNAKLVQLFLTFAIEHKKVLLPKLIEEQAATSIRKEVFQILERDLQKFKPIFSELKSEKKNEFLLWQFERKNQVNMGIEFLPFIQSLLLNEENEKAFKKEGLLKLSIPYLLQLLEVSQPLSFGSWAFVLEEIWEEESLEKMRTHKDSVNKEVLIKVLLESNFVSEKLIGIAGKYESRGYNYVVKLADEIKEALKSVVGKQVDFELRKTLLFDVAIDQSIELVESEVFLDAGHPIKEVIHMVFGEQKTRKKTGQSYTSKEVEKLIYVWEAGGVKKALIRLLSERKLVLLKWIAVHLEEFSDEFKYSWNEEFVKEYSHAQGEFVPELSFMVESLTITTLDDVLLWLQSFLEEKTNLFTAPAEELVLTFYKQAKAKFMFFAVKAKGKVIVKLWKLYPLFVETILEDLLKEELKRTDNPEYWLKQQKLWSKPLEQIIKNNEMLPVQAIVRKWLELKEQEGRKSQQHLDLVESEPLYVDNAGLVLLNPYITRLFKMLNFLNGSTFVSEEKQHRAVCVLQYLATSQKQFQEFDLTINKLFCGLTITDYVDPTIVLTAKEMEACDGLLKAVINHWKAIGNSSVENLRASFLMRPGVLRKEIKGWQLTVEKKAYDMLLERLPWGIGMVKFAWMDDVIVVEWMN